MTAVQFHGFFWICRVLWNLGATYFFHIVFSMPHWVILNKRSHSFLLFWPCFKIIEAHIFDTSFLTFPFFKGSKWGKMRWRGSIIISFSVIRKIGNSVFDQMYSYLVTSHFLTPWLQSYIDIKDLFIYLFERVRGREREIVHPLVNSPGGCNCQHWDRLKPWAKSFIWVSHVCGRVLNTWAILHAFPRPLAWCCIGSRAVGTQTGSYIECWCH